MITRCGAREGARFKESHKTVLTRAACTAAGSQTGTLTGWQLLLYRSGTLEQVSSRTIQSTQEFNTRQHRASDAPRVAGTACLPAACICWR